MRANWWYEGSFWTCCILLLVPLLSVEYLPMVDLPQHAAQLGIWTRWSDPEFGYQQIYIRNWFTPYLAGYLLTFSLTPFLSVKAALTTVIAGAVVAVPVATRFLLRESGGSRWWVFAVFPGVFGYSFDWGFFNFLVGVPITIALIVLALRYAQEPDRRGGLVLFGAMAALFFVHALLFIYISVIVGISALFSGINWKTRLLAITPIVSLTPLVLLWLYITRNSEALVHRPMIWELPGQTPRLLRLFSETAGDAVSPYSLLAGGVAFALPLILGARPSRSAVRWIPFTTTAAVFLLVPHEFFGTAFLYSRFAVFVIPTWLYAMELPPTYAPSTTVQFALGPALAIACTFSTTLQFWAFEPEVAGLAKLIDQMPANAKVLSVPIHRNSTHIRTPVFLHTPLWYQAEKGGVVDFSFAVNFPPLFRYRRDSEPRIPRMFVWNTRLFDWNAFEASRYDYFVVRDFSDGPSSLMVESKAPVKMLGRAGPWQLFAR